MTKTELRKMTKKDLLALAKKKRIKVSESMLKPEIVDTIHGRLSKGTGQAKTRAKTKTKAKAKAKTKAKAKAKTKAKAKAKTKAKKKTKAKSGAQPEAKKKAAAKRPPVKAHEWDNARAKVELRKTKPLRTLNDDYCCIWHIHADFNNRCCYKHIDFMS